MAVTVELGAFDGFTLDSPLLGRLDENKLDGGITFVDVSSDVISVGVSRGRNRDLGRTSAGQVSVSFRNEDRRFDPLNAGSDLVRYVVPRKPVRVVADGSAVFTGLVDDWNFDYALSGLSVASLSGSDAFSLFARELNSGGTAVEELSGARVNRVLDGVKVAWPAVERDVADGNATLAAGVVDGNALTYLQGVEESEAGLIFMGKGGEFAFRERLVSQDAGAVTFSDEGSGIIFEAVATTYGAELLANDVVVSSSEGTVTASNVGSQTVYGVVSRSVETFLASGSLQGLADYIASRYGEPEFRVEAVTVNLRAISDSERADVLGLELGDQAKLVYTPNGVGDRIALRNRVIGISHSVGIDSHRVTFAFEELEFNFFILDDDPAGRLDADGVLGF